MIIYYVIDIVLSTLYCLISCSKSSIAYYNYHHIIDEKMRWSHLPKITLQETDASGIQIQLVWLSSLYFKILRYIQSHVITVWMLLKPSSCSLRGTNLPRVVSTLTSTCGDCLPGFALCIHGMPQETYFAMTELPINHLGLPVFVRKPILWHLLFNIVGFMHVVCVWYRFVVMLR